MEYQTRVFLVSVVLGVRRLGISSPSSDRSAHTTGARSTNTSIGQSGIIFVPVVIDLDHRARLARHRPALSSTRAPLACSGRRAGARPRPRPPLCGDAPHLLRALAAGLLAGPRPSSPSSSTASLRHQSSSAPLSRSSSTARRRRVTAPPQPGRLLCRVLTKQMLVVLPDQSACRPP